MADRLASLKRGRARAIGAAIAVALVTSSPALASLNVGASSGTDLLALVPNQEFTIDVVVSTTTPEALAVQIRAIGYDPALLEFVGGTSPDCLFGSPGIGCFAGIPNQPGLPAEQPAAPGLRPDVSVLMFSGLAGAPAFTTGPASFQLVFRALAPGMTSMSIGSFPAYGDSYQGGDGLVNNASLSFTIVPEPSTALLLGLGLGALATRRR